MDKIIDSQETTNYYFDPKNIQIKYIFKVYKIEYNNSKYTITTPICRMPFGTEKYSNKYIANLEFDLSDNESYNYIAAIKYIDKLFSKKELKMPYKFTSDAQESLYTLSLKERTYKFIHHRCHIKNINDFPLSEELKGKNLIVTIELDSMWVNKNSYGLIWLITNIKILS